MNIAKFLGGLVAGSALLAMSVQAVPITGGISMAGGYVPTGSLDSGPVSFAFPTPAIITSVSGSYLPVPTFPSLLTPPVTYVGFSAVPSSAPQALWSFTFGGNLYSFDLASLSVISRGLDANGNPFINLQGNGTLKISGGVFDPTPGSWNFTANSASSTFSFSSSNGALPDGGTTVMLLGSALAVLGMARRYFAA